MMADVGTMNRMPKQIPEAVMRELAYTGRSIDGAEAQRIGLVNRTFADQGALLTGVMVAGIVVTGVVFRRASKATAYRTYRHYPLKDGHRPL